VTVRSGPELAFALFTEDMGTWWPLDAWDPPSTVVMAWRPHSMPEPPTEVEVTFRSRNGATVVDLEHRGWERVSEDFRERLYEVYVRGWDATLDRFAAAADRGTV